MKKLLFLVFIFAITGTKAQLIIDDISKPDFTLQDEIGEKLAELALSNKGIAVGTNEIKSAVVDVKKAKAAWLNQLTSSFNLNEFSIKSFSGTQINNFFPRYNFNLSIPLGLFSTKANDVKAARLKVEGAQLQQELFIIELKRQVKTVYQSYLASKYNLALQESLLQDEKILLDRVSSMFENNQVDLEVFTNAQSKYNDLLVKKVATLQSINTSLYQLEALIGMKLEDAMKRIGKNEVK